MTWIFSASSPVPGLTTDGGVKPFDLDARQ